jgi:hypothetical protein
MKITAENKYAEKQKCQGKDIISLVFFSQRYLGGSNKQGKGAAGKIYGVNPVRYVHKRYGNLKISLLKLQANKAFRVKPAPQGHFPPGIVDKKPPEVHHPLNIT